MSQPPGDGTQDKLAERLFHQARRLDAEGRVALLRDCTPAVRAEVEALLDAHGRAEQAFMATPRLGADFKLGDSAAAVPARHPAKIGSYRILEMIGAGGMGTVYLAEQDHPRRRVALKVIRAGVATPAMLRRFEHEAELLGRLHHAGIAQVHEAGVDNEAGLPFIAMEFVDGRSLLEFARAEDLGQNARLGLFARICDAVEHAHQMGVIHRDLKPGNILVEKRGNAGLEAIQPKILDFGIARATDADIRTTTMQTDVGQLLGTIQYMSPEQASGDTRCLDTRSDVYALGVILFELLTDRLPYDLDNRLVHEAARIIQQDEPTTLSAIDRRLAGDVTTIVSRALEKERERRYQSAAELGADLRRYLDNEPILAHPPSTMYQLRKFARRNRALVTLVSAVFLSLVVGLVSTFMQWRETETARDLAERRFRDVADLANAFIDEFDSQIMHVPGTLRAREMIVRRGLEYLDRLAAEAGDDPESQNRLVAGYSRIGDIQGAPAQPNLGDREGALTSYRLALAINERLMAGFPIGAAPPTNQISILARIGDLLHDQLEYEQALAAFLAAREFWSALHAEDAERPPLIYTGRIGDLQLSLGRADEAEAEYRLGLAEARDWAARHPGDWQAQRDVHVMLLKLPDLPSFVDREEDKLAIYEECVDRASALRTRYPHNAVLQRDLAMLHGRIGTVLRDLGRLPEAREHGETALQLNRQLVESEPSDAQALMDYSMASNTSGELALAAGRPEEARAHFERVGEIAARLVALDPNNAAYLRRSGVALFKMGEYHAARGRDASLAPNERRTRWLASRAAFSDCLTHFLDLETRALLWASDASVPDEIRAEIERCDTALADLAATN